MAPTTVHAPFIGIYKARFQTASYMVFTVSLPYRRATVFPAVLGLPPCGQARFSNRKRLSTVLFPVRPCGSIHLRPHCADAHCIGRCSACRTAVLSVSRPLMRPSPRPQGACQHRKALVPPAGIAPALQRLLLLCYGGVCAGLSRLSASRRVNISP